MLLHACRSLQAVLYIQLGNRCNVRGDNVSRVYCGVGRGNQLDSNIVIENPSSRKTLTVNSVAT